MKLQDILESTKLKLEGSSLDGYYLSQRAADLWHKDNPDKKRDDFWRAGVNVTDKYTEKAGGIKGEYRGKGVSNWTISKEGRIEDTFGTKTIDKHDKPRKKDKRVDEILPAMAVFTGLRLLGGLVVRHVGKEAVKKAVVGKVGKEAVKKAVTNGTKAVAPVAKNVIKKAAPVVGKVAKTVGKKAVGPVVGGAVVVGGVNYVVDQVFDKIDEALEFLSNLFGDIFDIETLKKMADLLVKYGLPIAGILAVAYGGKVLVDYIRGEDEDPDEFDDVLTAEAEGPYTNSNHSKNKIKKPFGAGAHTKPEGGNPQVCHLCKGEGCKQCGNTGEEISPKRNDPKGVIPEDEKYYANDPTFVDPDGPRDGMIGEPDKFFDAEERTEAYNDLQDALGQCNSTEAEYVKDGSCPECPNVEDDEDCNGFGNYGCDDGILTYNGDDVSWKAIKDHDERQAQRQSAKDNYPGDEAVVKQVANMVKNMDDPRDAMKQMAVDYPQMGRRQRADLVAKGMKLAGLTKEGKSPHKKGTAKHKKHMAAMHAGMGEGMNEELQIQKIKNGKGEIIQYTILNGEPFDVNGAPLEYGPYWDIMTADGHSDIEINSNMWPDYEKHNAGIKGYESIQAGDELMIETGMGEGVIAPVIHVVGENVLISWDATADSLFEETEEMDEGEKHGNSKIYNKCWKGYSKVPGKSAGEKGSCKKNEDIEEASFDQNAFDEIFKDRKPKPIDDDCPDCNGNGWIPDEPEKECPKCDGEGKDDGYFGGTKAYEEIERMRHLAGLSEEVVDFERFKQLLKLVKRDGMEPIQRGDNKITTALNIWLNDQIQKGIKYNSKDPINVARMLLKFEKETGKKVYKLISMPPKQRELELSPGTPSQTEFDFESIDEAEYQGRKVKLGKPTRGDVKKFKVYVKDPKTGNVKKVNFGHGGSSAKKAGQKTMKIKKSNPARRKSFRARHNCDNPGPRTKARYWSCRAW